MAEKVKWNPNPRKVPAGATEVEMNGRIYHRADSVAAARWPYLEQYQAALIHGKRADQLYKVLRTDLKDALNKAQFMDASVILHNLINDTAAITDVKRLPSAVALTMLFWNHEGEEVGQFDQAVMDAKIEDARQSGIDMAFFFGQALSCIADYLPASTPMKAQGNGSPSGQEVLSKTPAPLPSDTE